MTDLGDIYIIGGFIPAGSPVVKSVNGRIYLSADVVAGEYIGESVTDLRAGFRAMVRGGEVREDDA